MIRWSHLFALAVCCASCRDPNTARNVANAVLDVEQAACVILQGELGKNEPDVVAQVCAIPPSALEEVINLLTAHRKAKARLASIRPAAPACKPDGGAP